MLAAIDRFLAAPLDATRDDTTRLIRFITESPDVMVTLTAQVGRWTTEGVVEDARPLLLLGFLAGNAGSQLRSGKKGDDVHAGVDGVLKVYRALKTKRVTSPALDQFLELEKQGKLSAYVDAHH
jgi:hypothetical protein